MIKVPGVVTKRTNIFPQLKSIIFTCDKCGDRKGPIEARDSNIPKIVTCIVCGSNGPFSLD